MKIFKVFSITICFLIIIVESNAPVFAQSNAMFRSFEMISNGSGQITGVYGFDVTRPRSDYGAYSADWYRDVMLGSGSILTLPGGMQQAGGWYFILAGQNNIVTHVNAVNRWTRDGTLDEIINGNTYEIRFTNSENKAILYYNPPLRALVDVPFELWYLGTTLSNTDDDVRMIPWLYDDNSNGIFDFKLDHQASSEDNEPDDPYSDWIYFMMPDDNSPGEDGYIQFVQDAENGDYNFGGQEHIARLVLMNWNQHQGDGSENAMPETGTIFRINVGELINIDIKPGSDANLINCHNDKAIIPVAILTTEKFDASHVNEATVRFGPNLASDIDGTGHLEDVDSDGDMDMVFHFLFGETGIQCYDSTATLRGEAIEGYFIRGIDAIRIVVSENCGNLNDPSIHEFNNLKLLISDDGRLASNDTISHFAYYPRNSCNRYIYAAGFWMGGIRDGQQIVAEAAHSTEFTPSEINGTGQIFRVFNSTYKKDIKNWPPEFSNPNGKPIIIPDTENLVVEYYDNRSIRDATEPLGVEVRQRSLAYKTKNIKNAIILIWEIKNISGSDITDAYFGFWNDADVGYAYEDRASIVDNIAIIWDKDFFDSGFKETPAIVGFEFLETPGERGLTHYITITNSGPNPDPNSDDLQYAFLNGSVQFETDWIGDVRTLSSTGPFDLPSGASVIVSGAILIGDVPDGTTDLWIDPDNSFRPEPTDPVLANLLNTSQAVRNFYNQNLNGLFKQNSAQQKSETELSLVPTQYKLYPVFPNPFNPQTVISYDLPEDSYVELSIFNTIGQKITTLVKNYQSAGKYHMQWQPEQLPSGLYIIYFTVGEFHQTEKILFIK